MATATTSAIISVLSILVLASAASPETVSHPSYWDYRPLR
jgi:hypothetical protein